MLGPLAIRRTVRTYTVAYAARCKADVYSTPGILPVHLGTPCRLIDGAKLAKS